jgi:hypothetical protein
MKTFKPLEISMTFKTKHSLFCELYSFKIYNLKATISWGQGESYFRTSSNQGKSFRVLDLASCKEGGMDEGWERAGLNTLK